MRKQLIENAAYDIATQVRTVEDAIDATLSDLAELQSRMIAARGVMGVGPATGHEALAQLSVTVSALIQARGSMVECHRELASAQRFVPGLRTVSFGDGSDCPPASGAMPTPLRVVA
ncbi:hypothetical protein ABDK56_05730 [Sphingomonas sp. ASV193]|uniref:hypothetical protein n=1 Tax=Sphingomonas sp. ASV193 TaxID=3144405 RepID=UPI0032E90073